MYLLLAALAVGCLLGYAIRTRGTGAALESVLLAVAITLTLYLGIWLCWVIFATSEG